MFIVSLDQTNKLDNVKDKRERVRERTLHRQKKAPGKITQTCTCSSLDYLITTSDYNM